MTVLITTINLTVGTYFKGSYTVPYFKVPVRSENQDQIGR